MLGSCSHVRENKVIRILKRGEELNETWFPTIFSDSSSSDDDKDRETMIDGCTSSSKAGRSKKRRNVKTRKRVDNLNARQVIPSSCSSSSNDDDYDFLKAEVAVLKTFARTLSKPKKKKDKKVKKNKNVVKEDEKAKKKKNKDVGKEKDDKPAKKNKKRGNNTKSRWVISNCSCSCSCSSSDDKCDIVKSEASVVSSDYDWKYVGGLYLNSPLPSSLPVPGKTASSLLVSPPPSSLPLPWFLLPVGLLS